MRNVFVLEDIDEAKVRDEAYKRAIGDKRNPPESTMIHFHAFGFNCHQQFPLGKPCELILAKEEENEDS